MLKKRFKYSEDSARNLFNSFLFNDAIVMLPEQETEKNLQNKNRTKFTVPVPS